MSVVGEWIEKQRMSAMRGVASSGPTLHPMLPLAQRMTDQFAQPGAMDGPQSGNGDSAKFTGRGESSDPAGIVHRNEMVVEEGMVNDFGGPENVRATLEDQRDKRQFGNMKEFPRGTGRGTAGLPKYQTGTGAGTAGAPKPAEPPTKPATNNPPTFTQARQEGMAGIRDIARGDSETMDVVGRVARGRLGGQQAAERGATSQTLAQEDASVAEARTARAMEGIRQGSQSAEMERGLAVEEQQRRERATGKLADIGLRGEKFEEQKRQYEKTFKEQKREYTETFNENKRRWGEQFAFEKDKVDWTHNRAIASDQLSAGDFEGAAKTYKNMGVKVDMSNLQDKENADKFNTAMDGFATSIAAGLDLQNESVQKFMNDAYAAQHPGQDLTKEPAKSQLETWKQNSYDAVRLKNNPIYSAISPMLEPEIMAGFAEHLGLDSIDDFEYAGETGKDAVAVVLTNLSLNGGMGFDQDGNIVPDLNNPGWGLLGLTATSDDGDVSGTVDTRYQNLSDADKGVYDSAEFQGLDVGGSTYKNGIKYTKKADGYFEKVDRNYNPDADDPFGDKARAIIKEGKAANPDNYDKVMEAQGAYATENPFSTKSKSIIDEGQEANPELYDKIMAARTEFAVENPYSQKAKNIVKDGRTEENAQYYDQVIDAQVDYVADDPFSIKAKQLAKEIKKDSPEAYAKLIDHQAAFVQDNEDWSKLKNLKKGDPLFDSVLAKQALWDKKTSKTTNAWDDKRYFSAYGTEINDAGDVEYTVGAVFNNNGTMYEIVGQHEDDVGDGRWIMEVRDVTTGKLVNLVP